MATRRAFRIERLSSELLGTENGALTMEVVSPETSQPEAKPSGADTTTILAAIADIKKSLSNSDDLDALRGDIEKAAAMNGELSSMQDAIVSTKQEIAALHGGGFQDDNLGRVTNELDAVVEGTEAATESILSAAESIDELAGNLSAALSEPHSAMASDIQDKIVEIFEACNFQDLTGQRITKVVRTLEFIEDRVGSMMEIWGGMDSFKDVESSVAKPEGDAALLNGPSLETDIDVANQDDIDALFD
ncbi:MAG: protein phosphatase CheZ [Hyphomicrobiales bacterium]